MAIGLWSLPQQGKLAKELDFVSHHVRTKLDELKRQEVSRLRTLIKAKQDLEGGNGMQRCLLDAVYRSKVVPVCMLSEHANRDHFVVNVQKKKKPLGNTFHCVRKTGG